MVGDGNCGMAPADGLLNDLLGVRQGIHIAHFGMQVQLHPLDRSGILAFLVLDDIDVVGIELDVLSVPGRLHLSLHAKPHARLDGAAELLGLLGGQVFVDSDGIGVIRHIKIQAPHPGTPGLGTLGGKHLACHGGGAHFQIQILHGDPGGS